MNKLKLLCLLLVILASLVSFSECNFRRTKSENPPSVEKEDQQDNSRRENIIIPPEILNKYQLTVFQVSENEIFKTVQFPVVIEREEGNITEIRAGFPGKIDAIFADGINAQVEIGQPLFSISSPTVLKIQQNYLEALKKVIDEPGNENQNLSEAEAYKQQLLEYNFNQEDLVNLVRTERPYSTFTFYSKVRGILGPKKVFPGMNVQAETVLFSVKDLSKGIAEGDVPGDLKDFFHIGMPGALKIAQLPDNTFVGYLYSVGLGETATSPAKVQFIFKNLAQVATFNKSGSMSVNLSLGNYLSIPKQSIIQINQVKTVYILLNGKEFSQRVITTGLEGDTYVQVLSGLREGDYVSTNPLLILNH